MNLSALSPHPSLVPRPETRELPVGIIRAVRRFPKPHADLFDLALTLPSWLQLLESAPALAFLIARCWLFDGLPEEEAPDRIRGYLQMRRSAVCEALGFPSGARTLHILRRTKTGGWPDCLPLLILRELLRHEPSALDILGQAPEISEDILVNLAFGGDWNLRELIPNRRQVAGLAWFFRLPAPKRYFLASLHGTILRNQDSVETAFLEPLRPLAALRNERKAVTYLRDYQRREDLINGTFRKLLKNEVPHPWPTPPLRGTARIVPITSRAALIREGDVMAHCVGLYVPNVLRGAYFVYQILARQRCTLGLRFRDGEWRIDQLMAARNEPVTDPAICREVETWLWNFPRKERRISQIAGCVATIAKITGLPIRRK